jgi:4-hydroxybenzoate polyprenyltransferase
LRNIYDSVIKGVFILGWVHSVGHISCEYACKENKYAIIFSNYLALVSFLMGVLVEIKDDHLVNTSSEVFREAIAAGFFIKALILSLRPKHWVKNFFIFAPLIFSQNLLKSQFVILSIGAFFAFCVASSSVYLVNDVLDIEQDKIHPQKKNRPIASGVIKPEFALIFAGFLAIFSLVVSSVINYFFMLVLAVYIILNLFYSLWLKNIVILDVLVLSVFYLLRVVGGGIAIGVSISSWLIVCTVLLALFLGFGKRRHEVLLMQENASQHRKILSEYNPYFLDQMIGVVTASTLMAYALYTMSEETVKKFGTKGLPLTIPFVLYGIFRYLYLVHQKEEGGSPTQLMLTDKPLIATVLLWVIAVAVIIYK